MLGRLGDPKSIDFPLPVARTANNPLVKGGRRLGGNRESLEDVGYNCIENEGRIAPSLRGGFTANDAINFIFSSRF